MAGVRELSLGELLSGLVELALRLLERLGQVVTSAVRLAVPEVIWWIRFSTASGRLERHRRRRRRLGGRRFGFAFGARGGGGGGGGGPPRSRQHDRRSGSSSSSAVEHLARLDPSGLARAATPEERGAPAHRGGP